MLQNIIRQVNQDQNSDMGEGGIKNGQKNPKSFMDGPLEQTNKEWNFLNKYIITTALCNTYPHRTLVPPPNVQSLSPALLGPRVKIDIFPNGLLYGENSIKLVHFWEQNKVVAFASAVQKKIGLIHRVLPPTYLVAPSKAMKSSPLLRPFGDSEFWEFSLLKIQIGREILCFKLQTIVSCALIHSTLLSS